MYIYIYISSSGQIAILPKPELSGFLGDSPTFSPPFGVTSTWCPCDLHRTNQASMESSTGSFQLCHLADLRARPHTGGTPPNDWRIVSWNGAQVIHGNGAAQINHPTENNEKSDIFSKSLASTKYTWKWKSLQIPHFQVFDVSFCCWCCWVFIATWSHHFVASRETPWFTLPKFWQQWAGTCCRLWRRAPQNSKGGKLYHRKDQTEKSQVSVSVIKWNEVCFFCDRLRTVKLAVNDQGGSFCVEILQRLQWNTQMLSKLYVNILQRKCYLYQIYIYII